MSYAGCLRWEAPACHLKWNAPELSKVAFEGTLYSSTGFDAEQFAKLYEEQGPAALTTLDGPFALALWDRHRKQLLLAHDPKGKRPVYYQWTEQGIAFGFSLESLRQFLQEPLEIEPLSVAKYLVYGHVPAPRTLLRGVAKLPAGHYGLWRDGRFVLRRYFDLVRKEENETPLDAWEQLQNAVRKRLSPETPAGVLLWGGADSGLLAAAMTEETQAAVLQTFSIGFESAFPHESLRARQTANFFGTDHHERIVKKNEIRPALEQLARQKEEPIGDAALLSHRLLAEWARSRVSVVLSAHPVFGMPLGFSPPEISTLMRRHWEPEALYQEMRIETPEKLFLSGMPLPILHQSSRSFDLEVRLPFADCPVPPLLKTARKKKLPSAILKRTCEPESLPDPLWLKKEMKEWMFETLHPMRLKKEGLFDPLVVQQMLREQDAGAADHRKKLWSLLTLEWWREQWRV